MSQFQVKRNQFSISRITEIPTEEEELGPEEILVNIDYFAYTANNITYAVAGNTIGYWEFFPAYDNLTKEWGLIPVWGFGDVVASNNDAIPVGDRLFGFFPPASSLKILPVKVTAHRLIDASAHRAHLPVGYNLYRRVLGEEHYNRQNDYLRMIFLPLHITSFCLWDSLQDNNWFDAEQIIILSASSKTSIGLAIALDEDDSSPPVTGLTSDKNKSKVESLDLYNQVLAYDELNQIAPDKKSILIDMSGNTQIAEYLVNHLKENLINTIQVGFTHWENTSSEIEAENIFFAPAHIQKRVREWGLEKFEQESNDFMKRSGARMSEWMTIQVIDGIEGLAAIHKDVCEGKIEPDIGLIVKLRDSK